MGGPEFVALAVGTFVVVVGLLGVLPVMLCRSAVRSAAPRRGLRLRTMQSQMAGLVVLAPIGVYLASLSLVSAGHIQPLAVGVVAAGVVLLPIGVVTYVWLNRRVPDGR